MAKEPENQDQEELTDGEIDALLAGLDESDGSTVIEVDDDRSNELLLDGDNVPVADDDKAEIKDDKAEPKEKEEQQIEGKSEPPEKEESKPKVEQDSDDKGDEKTKQPSDDELIMGDDGVERPRYAHFQRLSDKRGNRLEKLEGENKDLNDVKPIARYINQNPELLKFVDQYMKGQQLPAVQLNSPPEKPKSPERPANFSMDEAINDPDSDSAKFQLNSLEYPAQLEKWREANETYVTAEGAANSRIEQAQQFQQKIESGVFETISKNDQFKNVDAKALTDNVMDFFGSSDALRPEIMLSVYLQSVRSGKQSNDVKKKAEQMIRDKQTKKENGPLPASVTGSTAGEESVSRMKLKQADDDKHKQAFEDDLLSQF